MMEKPLVCFFISMIIGDLCGILLNDFLFLDVAIAASFLICVFLICEKKFFAFMMLFFIIGFSSLLSYFGVGLPVESELNVRIINKSQFYTTASYIGRKVSINGNLKNVDIGQKVLLKGYFNKSTDYDYGVIGNYKVIKIGSKSNDFISILYTFKDKIHKKFNSEIGEELGSEIMAIAFGDSAQLSQDSKNDFKGLGIVYAICVSGLHMLIVFKVLRLCLSLELSIIGGIIYTLFTGCQPSTVRALIMIIILKYSKKLSKNYDVYSALSLAGMLLVLLKPYYILDVGFMLSFLATLGIAMFYKKISKALYKLPKRINESLSISLSVQSLSLPYALFTLKSFSFGSILGNIFLVPIFSILVVLGNVALVASPVKMLFGIISMPIYMLLTALNGGISILLKLTPPMVYIPPIYAIFIMYLYLCYILMRKGYKSVKYGPMLFFVIILINQYSFLPGMSYLQLKNGYGFLVKDKWNTILVSNYEIKDSNERQELKGKFFVNKFVNNAQNSYDILVRNKYLIIIPKSQGKNKTILKVINVKDKNNIIYFYNDGIKYYGINCLQNYDIINEDSSEKKSNLPKDDVDLEIINNKVLVLK
ncbi:ComEC/Rec2 family competence protein [Clostridium akagii]|uniref:ComEC/Rec2 family competence protein n=1 Tax=Clostridium akagii TaxID=91623 RepID=UPI00047B39B7|nr:ComEC/Rec2 family competence protein [Clostridium akagii]